MPTQEAIFASRWLKPLAPWFDKPEFWHLNRRKAASSVAIGLFCGLLPAPTQMISALLAAYARRTNLPLAVLTTLYTNPFTFFPLYYVAYHIGHWLLYQQQPDTALIFPDWHSTHYWQDVWLWLLQFGKPLLVGVPILGAIFALIGYTVVWWSWRWYTLWKQRTRAHLS